MWRHVRILLRGKVRPPPIPQSVLNFVICNPSLLPQRLRQDSLKSFYFILLLPELSSGKFEQIVPELEEENVREPVLVNHQDPIHGPSHSEPPELLPHPLEPGLVGGIWLQHGGPGAEREAGQAVKRDGAAEG